MATINMTAAAAVNAGLVSAHDPNLYRLGDFDGHDAFNRPLQFQPLNGEIQRVPIQTRGSDISLTASVDERVHNRLATHRRLDRR